MITLEEQVELITNNTVVMTPNTPLPSVSASSTTPSKEKDSLSTMADNTWTSRRNLSSLSYSKEEVLVVKLLMEVLDNSSRCIKLATSTLMEVSTHPSTSS